LALCTLLITHNSDSAESHLTQLTKLLGSDHERVHMAQDRFDLVQKLDKAQR